MVVALGLLSLLLATLFSFLLQSVVIEKKVATAREAVLMRQGIQLHLEEMLTSLLPWEPQALTPPPLYTLCEGDRVVLYLLFDHGIDPDPAFSGAVMGKLFLDEKGNFVSIITPLPSAIDGPLPYRKEVLFSKVSRCEFQFFSMQRESSEGVPVLWKREFSEKERQTPSMVRLYLWDEKEICWSFVFFLPSASPTILCSFPL